MNEDIKDLYRILLLLNGKVIQVRNNDGSFLIGTRRPWHWVTEWFKLTPKDDER